MVQLRFLSGPKAGGSQAVRRFPFHVGRAPDNDLCVDAAGIWDYHFMLNLRRNEGFMLQTFDQALAAVNDEPQVSARLRNGDVISFGSAKIQFWLSAPVQRSLRSREWFVWLLLLLITLGQIALIAWLLGLG
ncbi:MAG: FHA domain-containing protein [Verrucomicrobiota bacterium]|jgi:pSer/pThr/pTyr-binding forkhead associated (FHA) protein